MNINSNIRKNKMIFHIFSYYEKKDCTRIILWRNVISPLVLSKSSYYMLLLQLPTRYLNPATYLKY